MLENQVYSIEAANINQETLNAMKNAGKAMKDIHGNLTIDKVDQIMYASLSSPHHTIKKPLLTKFNREELTEQKELANEIGTAIANGPQTGEPIDEAELEDELAAIEQEQLDEKMLKTGTVMVLPTGPNGEGKSCISQSETASSRKVTVKGKARITAEEEDEEEELRKLQAEMAM